ncbi:hypothetical protein EGW08_020269 [Elysia chlorotica]|uniref:Uncharacterized protein n=1 Tax=Elysia chlorotica TaxID=188477 RepID=A0A3S1H4D7_ELYCH|nr:hypothetical protein EGW08_020269 [Elysia chlorotica]
MKGLPITISSEYHQYSGGFGSIRHVSSCPSLRIINLDRASPHRETETNKIRLTCFIFHFPMTQYMYLHPISFSYHTANPPQHGFKSHRSLTNKQTKILNQR